MKASSTFAKLAILVCTSNRKGEVERLLSKLAAGYSDLGLVLIVDSSDTDQRLSIAEIAEIQKFNPRARFEYLQTQVKSLPGQKSLGVSKLQSMTNLEFVMFLDDDTFLPSDTALEMVQLLAKNDDLVALSGVTGLGQPEMSRLHRIFKKTFLLDSDNEGALLSSGINIPIRTFSNILVKSEWLIGCSLWNIKDLDASRFPSTLPGSALYEDVIISQSARGVGGTAVAPWLNLEHSESPANRPNSFLHARRNQRNRYELVKMKEVPVRRFPFWWASFGLVLESISIMTARILRLRWRKLKDPILALSGIFVGSIDIVLTKKPR